MTSQPWWPALFKPGMKRLMVSTVLLLLSVTGALAATSPPTMVSQPPQEGLFHVRWSQDENHMPFVLACQAEGEPDPQYEWTKNNKLFDYAAYDDRISPQPGRGSLVFTAPEDGDEGLYQCRATNNFGTSVSNAVLLRKVQLNSFPDEEIRDVSVKEGEPFSLHCDPPKGYPRPHVSWFVQNQNGALRMINTSRITADPDGGLHFSRADLGDALVDGFYACSVMSRFLHKYKLGNKIRLHVEPVSTAEPLKVAPVKQYLSPENIVALRGSELRLHCIYGGTPLPVTTWSKDGVAAASPRFTYGNSGKTLIVEQVEFEDEGTYECGVENGAGAGQSHVMRVKVEAEPYWLNAPNNTDADYGERVVFKCDAMGVPEPSLEWFVNGVPISNAKPNPRRTVIGSILTIESLERDDTAVYQCNASNSHGYAFRDFYLNVHADAALVFAPARWTTAVVMSNATLRCRVHGAPRPHVMWFKDGRPLTGGRYLVLDSGDLQISDVQFADAGEYTCFAINKFGEASASGNLDVQRRTRITSRPEDLKVAAGKTAMFRCGAETDPKRRELSVEWLFNGKLLDLDADPRLVVRGDNTLVVTRALPLDAGTYTCVARTQLDYDSANATLTVQGAPSPPQLLHVHCDNRAALVEWRPTGESQASILSYSIQYNTEFNPENWEDELVNIPATETKMKVSMSPWTNYTFRVLARNEIGFSKPSEPSLTCITPEDIPYKNPEHVVGRGDNFDNLVISWAPMRPVEHNAPGFFYRVLWKRDDLPGATWDSRNIEDWRQDRYVVSDQPTFKPYRIKVEAHNRRGQANTAAAEVIGYSGENVPLAAPKDLTLVELVDARSANLTWSPVDPETVRGHFRGYKIQTWTPEEGEEKLREAVVPASVTTAVVSILRPFSRNFVRVRVFNDQHNGPATDTIEFVTPEGTPGPVASFEAIPLGSTAFYLVWKQPQEANGRLTGYHIYYQELRGTQLGPVMERRPAVRDPLVVHAKLAGLKPRATYRITIRAATDVGLGEPYFTEARTRDQSERLPDVPEFTWVHLPGGNDKEAIQVTWLPAIEGRPGSNFYVQYRRKGSETWETTMVEEYEDNIVVHDLERGALYEIRVVAVGGKHEQPSLVKEVVIGVPASSADPSFSTSKPAEQDDPLEAKASAQQPLIDAVQRTRADMLACHERAMDQNQRYSSTLLAALDRQARALEELKAAVQNGFAELQRSQRRSSQPPVEPREGAAT